MLGDQPVIPGGVLSTDLDASRTFYRHDALSLRPRARTHCDRGGRNLKPGEGGPMPVDAGYRGQHRPDLMERSCRAATAVAAGYLLAFSVAGADVTAWFLAAIVASGILAATASLRALPTKLRLMLGAASAALFTVLGILGIPVTAGLLIGAFLVGGGTLSLFDSRADPLGDIPAR